jgi:thiamine biosynthesis lipoprotein
MKKYFLYIVILVGFLSCSSDEIVKRTTIIMGSTVEIQVRGINSVTANKAIFASFEEVKQLDTLFSTYMTGNPMWMLNNTDADEIVVTNEMFNMLKMCDEIWRMTNGAFDPAIGNLIEVIGFEKGSPKLPTSKQIENALGKIGWKNILLKKENIISKPKQMRLSFNAIVPGYAADKIANLLSNFGIKEYLINVGGEIFARGDNWKIGIQHPRKEKELLGTINLNGMGVSTSGDYEQYFKKDGKRYSHLLNPLSGYPADECEAVTIIAKEASLADALSTGVFILGPVKGMELIEKLENVEGIIVDTTGTIHESSGFKKFLVRK